jgi:hypothetical protein
VEVKDGVARFDSVDCDLGGWDAAQRGRGHGYVGWQRLRRQQLSEQPPLLIDIGVGGEGGLSQYCVKGLSLLGAHGGSPFGWVAGRPATTSFAARQVRRRHRITAIRATAAPQDRSSTGRRECAHLAVLENRRITIIR